MTMLNLSSKCTSKLLVAATLLVSGTIAIAPAQADSIKNVSIGGSAPTDYLLYDSNTTNTFLNPNASLLDILGGNAASPTGNVELAASSEKAGFDFTKNTTLNGKIGGRAISISSLTASDWASSYSSNGITTTFGRYWFDSALKANATAANGLSSLVGSAGDSLFNIFQTNGGFQRFSDPNISYVDQADNGMISIGLAGHYDASSLFTKSIDLYLAKTTMTTTQKNTLLGLKSKIANSAIQASEIVKTTYEGKTEYGFSFKATKSGLVEKGDGLSHTGNYVVMMQGLPPIKKTVPEPSIVLGLVSLGGLAARKLRRG